MGRDSVVSLLSSLFARLVFPMPADLDMDGDGLASLAELQTKYPAVPDEFFLEFGPDADGFVS